MSTFNLSNQEMLQRSQTLAKLETVSEDLYRNIIPDEMNYKRLNKIHFTVFGVDTLEIYLDKKIFEAKSLLITDFSTNGFFWAQSEEEVASREFQDLYETVNQYAKDSDQLADLKAKWCVAQFQGEWFRAYIESVLDKNTMSVFFVDYGTTAVVNHNETRQMDIDEIWETGPLAFPCILKDLTLSKFNKLKQFQYSCFGIQSIKIIEKSSVFEVELKDMETGNLLIDIL